MNTNRAPCANPILTHFISVGARALAFISVVCGDELVAEITSYTTAALMPMTAASASLRAIIYAYVDRHDVNGEYVAGARMDDED
jgi:hypothetical protein